MQYVAIATISKTSVSLRENSSCRKQESVDRPRCARTARLRSTALVRHRRCDWLQTLFGAGCVHILAAYPLRLNLVIFCRSFLFFLFERSWKSMKNDTTSARMRSRNHLGDEKMSKNRHLASSNLTFFTNCNRRKQFSQNQRRRADLQNFALKFLIFLGDRVIIFHSLASILPRLSTLKDHN